MHADQHVVLAGHLAHDQRQMLLTVEDRLVHVGPELAALGGNPGLGHQPDQLLVAAPVADQVGDGDDGQMVLLGEALQFGKTGHLRLVLGDDLAQDAGRREARGPAEVDRGLGVPRPLQHAPRPVAQGEDMTGPVQIAGPGRLVDQCADGRRPVGGRDPGRGAVAEVDAHGEGGPLDLGVGDDHEGEVEGVGPLRKERHADHPGGVGQEECDVLGGRRLRRHHQVTLVLAVLVVDHHDHAEASDGIDGLLNLGKAHQAATSTRRSSPSCRTETNFPLHTSPIVPAPGPAKSGRPSSPPKNAGAR